MEIVERLNREYEDKFAQLGASFEAWASDIHLGADVLFQGPKGPQWTDSIRHQEDNSKTMIPSFKRLLPLEQAELLLRERLDDIIDHLWAVSPDVPGDLPEQPEFKRKLAP